MTPKQQKQITIIALILSALFIFSLAGRREGSMPVVNQTVRLAGPVLATAVATTETLPVEISSIVAPETPAAEINATSVTATEPSLSEQLYLKFFLLIRQYKEDDAIVVLREILKNNPNDLRAQGLLSDLYYKKDRLSEAILIWEKIVHDDPLNQPVRALLEKGRQELKAHELFTHETTRHFTIKFEGAENRNLYRDVLENLEEAYREVGRALSFYPAEEVIVFLYTNQQFFDVTRAPAWAGGLFDGKIRIPSLGYETQKARLREVIFHEYVHSVVQRMTDSGAVRTENTQRVPIWLNEGLAQYLEPSDKKKNINARLTKTGLIPLSQLHHSFMGLNASQAAIAYDESLSAVSFLIDEFGLWRLKRLLEELGQNGNIDEAMRSTLLISYEQFQLRWQSSLQH